MAQGEYLHLIPNHQSQEQLLLRYLLHSLYRIDLIRKKNHLFTFKMVTAITKLILIQ